MRKLALIFRSQIVVSGVLAIFSFLIFYLEITLGIFAQPIRLYTFLRTLYSLYWLC